jgi:hypothetical protein
VFDEELSPTPFGVTVVGRSRLQRDGLFGFLTLAMAAALVRGLLGASTSTGLLVIGLIFGTLLVVIVLAWLRARRSSEHLEVSDSEISYVATAGAPRQTLERTAGEQLRFVTKSAGRMTFFGLYQPGSDSTVLLHLFSRKAVEAALLAHHWRIS